MGTDGHEDGHQETFSTFDQTHSNDAGNGRKRWFFCVRLCECSVLRIELINYFDHLIMHAERAPPHVYVFLSVLQSHSRTMERTRKERPRVGHGPSQPDRTQSTHNQKGTLLLKATAWKTATRSTRYSTNIKLNCFFVRSLAALRNSIRFKVLIWLCHCLFG